ncbi:unnamed protein product [Urochloa decumbens]|uniref:Uncharacterized protein n=1 Tax=Urochloa decumbens TaxID=240449 RepID=A0ABC8VYE8_9POAL
MAWTSRSSEIVGLDYSDDDVLHAPSLRFSVGEYPHGEEPCRRLIAAADAALARRCAAGHPDVEALEINFVYASPLNKYMSLLPKGCWYIFTHRHATGITSAHVDAWLRLAARHVTGSFALAVPTLLGPDMRNMPADEKEQRFAELPASARAEAMSLSFGHALLMVPAAATGNGGAAFHALADLHLGHAWMEPGGADERNLGVLLSAASCPRLRRLRLEHIAGLSGLRLHAAATLEELRLDYIQDLTALELDAPGLRALHVANCFRMMDRGSTARISAPALETLAWGDVCRPEGLQIDAPSLRRLEKVYLYSHARADNDWNARVVGLLQQCSAADSLSMVMALVEPSFGMEDIKEMISCLPLLHNIINLTIKVDGGRWHELKATISRLVAKCSRVQCLSIDIKSANNPCSKPGCPCNLEDDLMISLEHLREAKITGFGPSNYHRSFVQLMIAGAPALEKMTVEFIKASLSQRQQNDDDSEDLGFNMPCKGQWSLRHGDVTTYEWTADSKREEARQDIGDPTLSRL